MRRYHVRVAGQLHVVDVQEVSSREFRVVVAGRDLDVTLSDAEDVAESVVSPEISPLTAAPPSTAAFRPVKPETFPPMVATTMPPLAAGSLSSDGIVKAPMPGTIAGVDVKPGDVVSAGQVLVKLEAMKMINAIRAPHDGRVATVPVQTGESVAYGQVLATFEGA